MNENQSVKNKPNAKRILVLIGLCVCITIILPILYATYLFETNRRNALAFSRFNEAYNLTSNENYAEAIPYWDRIIAKYPANGSAYYYRAKCYAGLTKNETVLSEYNSHLYQALEDIDNAIVYGVKNGLDNEKPGDPYYLRYEILDKITGGVEYSPDLNNIYRLEVENLRTAISLGISAGHYPEQWLPLSLFALGRCEEGWHEVQNAEEYYGLSAPPSASMLNIKAQGYLCRGRLDQALKYVDDGLAIEVVPERVWLRSIILYLKGDHEASLKELNDQIEKHPNYGGYRYYLRALIHYENGDRKLAESDLETGYRDTWAHSGIREYVLGRMALDDNKKELGIQYLQHAHSTLLWQFRLMRPKIGQELSKLGVKPLPDEPQLSVFLNATSMPASASTLKPSHTVPLTAYGFPAPPNITKINMSSGTGVMDFNNSSSSYPYPVLLFQPQNPVSIQSVKNLTLYMEPYSASESSKFEVFLWELKTGKWIMTKPGWGAEQISGPERFVASSGDVYVAVRCDGAVIILTAKNIWLSVEATETNGLPIILGLGK